jgi:hypothetical protein
VILLQLLYQPQEDCMNVLSTLLSLLGVAICSEIQSTHAQIANPIVHGSVISHIEQMDKRNPESRIFRHIMLQKLDTKHKFALHRPKAKGEADYSKGIVEFGVSPMALQLYVSIPVLDQGAYGTCVTFSTTAALDAVLGIKDVIDQQCSLELDQALGNNYWNGADFSSEIIDPLKNNGAVNKGKCSGDQYPNPMANIALDAYKKIVDPSIQVSKVQYAYHNPISIDEVKAALAAHHFVTIGIGLLDNGDPVSVQGFDAVINGKAKAGGLWACQQPGNSSNYCGEATAGHEIMVTGYDDSQQLLQIRNSWGIDSGNAGDFYMTYTFFSAMVIDATEIWTQ